jgi:hypothetical protein
MELSKKIIYKDYSIDALTDNKGVLTLLSGKQALENALRLWITSFKGEFNRNPEAGGYVTRWLTKPITDDYATKIRNAILDGLNDEFFPSLIVSKLEITPHYQEEFWEIHLEAYSPSVKESINIIENIRRLA